MCHVAIVALSKAQLLNLDNFQPSGHSTNPLPHEVPVDVLQCVIERKPTVTSGALVTALPGETHRRAALI